MNRNRTVSVLRRVTALVLSAGVMFSTFCLTAAADAVSGSDVASGSDASENDALEQFEKWLASASDAADGSIYDADFVSERRETSYSRVSARYTSPNYSGKDIIFTVADTAEDCEKLTAATRGYSAASKAADLTADDVVEMVINVPQSAVYELDFDYCQYDNSVMPGEFGLQVDGEYPFYECRNVELEITWIPKSEKSFDRYNDQMVTVPDKAVEWSTGPLKDSSSRHSGALLVELSEGEHTLGITVKGGSFLLGAVRLSAPTAVPEYNGSERAAGNALITIQGENYSAANDSSVHAVTEYDAAVTPYKVAETVLNTLDSDAFDRAGERVTYTFEVQKEGYYNIAVNYRQSDKTDFPVFVDLRIDGEIPNTAFNDYRFAYSTKYTQHTLADGKGSALSVWLDKGKHTVSFEISLDSICGMLEEIEEIMAGVNDLALEITKVAGTNSDKYRDLQLSRYIPGIENTLLEYAARLEEIERSAAAYTNGKDNVAIMASMLIAADQLRSLAENPDEIPYRIAELSSSQNSVNQYLANCIDNLLENGLAIDRIWIYQQDAKLPRETGPLKSLWLNFKRFVVSFFDQSYSTSNTDPDHLQVWVNRSSQYVQIMQKMIDEYFTPKTGIEVDISIMPDQYKLVLANSSGSAPDVATGINYTIPYELAVRGALADMTQFEDFKETASVYEPGFFLTGTIGDAVYSMPETMNFWVLCYRTDVLEKLGLEVPDTMDDVVAMLPELQMRGLNFYYPTAGMRAMRNFHGTTPLIVQNGGYLYYETAQEGTALGSEESVEGFTQLTDLFTVYDLPVDIDNFYQHFRNGDLPIGIADYGTYNLLKNAAPELDGSWEIALVPGTVQEDGSIDRSTCGCAESTVIFKSSSEREQKAWEFIKWWSSTEIQAEFGRTVQMTYGNEYLWTTANVEAFAQLPVDNHDKEVILEFAKNVIDVARVPGTYMLEREMSNAFNSIVVDGENERSRIDEAVKTINREIKRKLEEFGYIDSEGRTVKEYRIPTIETVKEILGRED